MKSTVSLASALVLLSIADIGGVARPVQASRNIYIRADGNVFPSTANITSVDNVTYIFTDNNRGSIVVQRDNVVIDGAGHVLQGRRTWYSRGIDLTERSNVTVKNMEIREFFFGVWLKTSLRNSVSGNNITVNKVGVWLSGSSNNNVSGNTVSSNMDYGIYLEYSTSNNISGNNITAKGKAWVSYLYYSFFGIYLHHSSGNSIFGNDMTNNEYGIELSSSNGNSISRNHIADNSYGILIWRSSDNTIHGNDLTTNDHGIVLTSSSRNAILHDNFVRNTEQTYSYNSTNVWDGGYPLGGNYWSDYEDRYPDAKEIDKSGIWDIAYLLDESNQDNCPLMKPWTPEAPVVFQQEKSSILDGKVAKAG